MAIATTKAGGSLPPPVPPASVYNGIDYLVKIADGAPNPQFKKVKHVKLSKPKFSI